MISTHRKGVDVDDDRRGRVASYRQILLVGEDQEEGITELVLVQHALQFLTGLDDTIAIVAVDDENDALSVLEVMSPQRTDLVLTTDVPNGELNVLVLDRLDIEPCAWRQSSVTRPHSFSTTLDILVLIQGEIATRTAGRH